MLFWRGKDDSKEAIHEFDKLPWKLRMKLKFGSKKIEVHENATIIRLGKRHILKKGVQSTEYEALLAVDKTTSIPIPKVLGVYNTREGVLVFQELVQGRTLDTVWFSLSAQQKKKIVDDLARFLDQLRNMKTQKPNYKVIGSATYGASVDHRFGRSRIGPFYTLDSFHEFIRRGRAPEDFGSGEVIECHHNRVNEYTMKFTHSEFCPQNILVDESGRVQAILDWEGAGWYPEYWEYVQMHFSTPKHMGEWLEMMEKKMPRYDQEFAAETALRSRYSSEDYDRDRSVRAPSPTPSELVRETAEIDDKNTENTSG